MLSIIKQAPILSACECYCRWVSCNCFLILGGLRPHPCEVIRGKCECYMLLHFSCSSWFKYRTQFSKLFVINIKEKRNNILLQIFFLPLFEQFVSSNRKGTRPRRSQIRWWKLHPALKICIAKCRMAQKCIILYFSTFMSHPLFLFSPSKKKDIIQREKLQYYRKIINTFLYYQKIASKTFLFDFSVIHGTLSFPWFLKA